LNVKRDSKRHVDFRRASRTSRGLQKGLKEVRKVLEKGLKWA
jgi:hypothetical protein